MKRGSSIAMEQMDKATEEKMQEMSKSRWFWLYALCLFVPGALRKVSIWLLASEIGSIAFYVVATPPGMPYRWPSLFVFIAASACIWLPYGWGMLLGENASLPNVRVRVTLLFKVIRRSRSFEDVTPSELSSLFPEPRTPPANVTIERYLSRERLLKRLGAVFIGLMFVFDAIWYSGVANSYVPLFAVAPPGTLNAAWLWYVQFLLFFTPMMAYFPITRRMARRIRVEDREKFVTMMRARDRRPGISLFDVHLEDLTQAIQGGAASEYLASRPLFRRLGFLSWWEEEYYPLPLFFIPTFAYILDAEVLQSAILPGTFTGALLSGLLAIAISVVLTMALMGVGFLTDETERAQAKSTRYLLSLVDIGGPTFSSEEMEHVAKAYHTALEEDDKGVTPSTSDGLSLREAAKVPLTAFGIMGGALLAGLAGGYLIYALHFPALPPLFWLGLVVLGAATIVVHVAFKLSKTSVPPETFAELSMLFALKEIGRERPSNPSNGAGSLG